MPCEGRAPHTRARSARTGYSQLGQHLHSGPGGHDLERSRRFQGRGRRELGPAGPWVCLAGAPWLSQRRGPWRAVPRGSRGQQGAEGWSGFLSMRPLPQASLTRGHTVPVPGPAGGGDAWALRTAREGSRGLSSARGRKLSHSRTGDLPQGAGPEKKGGFTRLSAPGPQRPLVSGGGGHADPPTKGGPGQLPSLVSPCQAAPAEGRSPSRWSQPRVGRTAPCLPRAEEGLQPAPRALRKRCLGGRCVQTGVCRGGRPRPRGAQCHPGVGR